MVLRTIEVPQLGALLRRVSSLEEKLGDCDHAAGGQQTSIVGCLGIRIDALDVHFLHLRARLDALEEIGLCKELCREHLETRLSEVHDSVLQAAEAMVNTCVDINRSERIKFAEEEQRRFTERQKLLARALGEELESSIVAQAVAEVRVAACAAARDEACTQISELRGQVSGLVDNLETSKRLTSGSSVLAGTGLKASPQKSCQHSISTSPTRWVQSDGSDGANALQQMGESVMQVEDDMKTLLQSRIHSLADQEREHAAVQSDLKHLRMTIERLTCCDLPQVWEHLEKLELQQGVEDNVSTCEQEPPFEYPVSQCIATTAPPPRPSATRAARAMSPGPSRHSPGMDNVSSCEQEPTIDHSINQSTAAATPLLRSSSTRGLRVSNPGPSRQSPGKQSPSDLPHVWEHIQECRETVKKLELQQTVVDSANVTTEGTLMEEMPINHSINQSTATAAPLPVAGASPLAHLRFGNVPSPVRSSSGVMSPGPSRHRKLLPSRSGTAVGVCISGVGGGRRAC